MSPATHQLNFGVGEKWFRILLILALIGTNYFSPLEAMRVTARLPGIGDNWEAQLETGLIALEANCDQNYMPFNRDRLVRELKFLILQNPHLEIWNKTLRKPASPKVMPFWQEIEFLQRDELKQCLRSVIAREPTNYYTPINLKKRDKSPSHSDLLRHIYIEPFCNKISESLECLQPHKRIIESCVRDDGKALQELMHVAFRGNGSKLNGKSGILALAKAMINGIYVLIGGEIDLAWFLLPSV